VSRYQKGKTNLDFTEATDSEWQWHQLSRMQVCTSLQTDNDASTPPLSFLHAGCPSCHPTNSIKAQSGKFSSCYCSCTYSQHHPGTTLTKQQQLHTAILTAVSRSGCAAGEVTQSTGVPRVYDLTTMEGITFHEPTWQLTTNDFGHSI